MPEKREITIYDIAAARTTVNYPGIDMGRIAANSLMEILDHESQVATENILLKHELIVRDSTLRSS
ncbi:MAG: hypothetical protein GY790_23605 [Bacteroidetes bacterium]|nr:hypothetical protein [Bacteroidota bacterium]